MTDRPSRPTALVTGATRGIGLAIARTLAPEHRLLLVARDNAGLEQVARQLSEDGLADDVLLRACDLAEHDQVHTLIERLEHEQITPQVLVNNAGIAPSASLARTDFSTWQRTLAINLSSPFALCQAFVPTMGRLGWGRVINIASTAALKGYRYTAAYSASKGGLLALTRAVAAEFAGKGVTVNAVCPGFTDTDIVATAVRNIASKTGRSADEARASLEGFSPIGRLIKPDEVAALVAYLASDSAAALTGNALPVDGGEIVL